MTEPHETESNPSTEKHKLTSEGGRSDTKIGNEYEPSIDGGTTVISELRDMPSDTIAATVESVLRAAAEQLPPTITDDNLREDGSTVLPLALQLGVSPKSKDPVWAHVDAACLRSMCLREFAEVSISASFLSKECFLGARGRVLRPLCLPTSPPVAEDRVTAPVLNALYATTVAAPTSSGCPTRHPRYRELPHRQTRPRPPGGMGSPHPARAAAWSQLPLHNSAASCTRATRIGHRHNQFHRGGLDACLDGVSTTGAQ